MREFHDSLNEKYFIHFTSLSRKCFLSIFRLNESLEVLNESLWWNIDWFNMQKAMAAFSRERSKKTMTRSLKDN